MRFEWRDNVFVERLWRSVKYEEVYLRAYESVSGARTSIGRYLESSIGGLRPLPRQGPCGLGERCSGSRPMFREMKTATQKYRTPWP
jgi:hypothetical protein